MTASIIAQRLSNAAAPTLVNAPKGKHVNGQTKPANMLRYEVVPFTLGEREVFKACVALERGAWEVDNKRVAITEAVRVMFGDVAPTFAQYRALQEAILLQAIEAGFTGQAMRKHVAAAVKAAYGALPVSDSPAAIAKRAQRPGKASKAPSADTLSDEPSQGAGMRMPSKEESIESFIARVGMVAALAAAMRILDAVDETKAEAAVIGSVIGHLTTPQQKAA